MAACPFPISYSSTPYGRLRWGIDLVRQARQKVGLDPDAIAYGAFISFACHPDIAVARRLAQGNLTVHAHFNVMHGKSSGPLSESQRQLMQNLHHAYDMRQHTRGDSTQAGVLTPAFIDQYAAVGAPDRVIDKLQALQRLGLDKFILGGSWRHASPGEGEMARRLLETEVLPALRG